MKLIRAAATLLTAWPATSPQRKSLK